MTPDDRRYTKTHEWIKIEDDVALVGITDYAQEALGDITFVELPTVGDHLEQGGESGVIESVKAASDLNAPIAGTISEVNSLLEESPETINLSPYEDGWLYKLKNFSEEDAQSLMEADQYEASLEEEEEE